MTRLGHFAGGTPTRVRVLAAVTRGLLGLALAAGASCALAQGAACAKAESAVDKQICATPALRSLDGEMGALYAEVRHATTPAAARMLTQQQRAWLHHRDEACATAAPACLRTAYEARRDQLQALKARAQEEDRLDDVTSVILRGRWAVGEVLDPEGGGHAPEPPDLKSTLALAGLPARGTMVTGRPGAICYAGSDCRDIGWTSQPLGHEVGGQRLASALGLDPHTPAFDGTLSATTTLMLIQRPDGHLLANFGLCGAGAADCRNGFQDWAPAGPDSRMEVTPSPPAG